MSEVQPPVSKTQREHEAKNQVILVNGVPVPVEIAGKAVSRCIRGIQSIDKLISTQGFASKDDLLQIRAGLTGEDRDTVAASGPARTKA